MIKIDDWVIEKGEKAQGKIEITGCGDGNAIECGNLYERFYFKGSWQSRGQKNGAGMTVTSGNVPEIALRLMHDYTNGNERIFTYENGW